ncbi:MAG: Gfo/Idh/MocA family protein [Candidatus Poribacteria bacterium]
MKKYRVAIVGLGRMASTIDDEVRDSLSDWIPYSIASSCQAIESVELVAGADILPEKREAFKQRWGVKALYEDYLEMIEKEKPDLVAICTKGDLHAEMGTKVASAGVPMIYLEKAIACSMKEADMLLDACRKNKTLLNTGVLRRFNRQYRKARQLMESGEIGQVRAIAHYGATNLLHGHIHSVDTIMYLLGDPIAKSVWGELLPRSTKIENNRLDHDPSAIYQIEFDGGVEVWTINAGNWDFEVWGTAGSIKSTDNGTGWVIRKPSSQRRGATTEISFPEVDGPSATVYCLLDLINAYEEGRQTIGNIEVTHRATEICLAIAESHIQGKRVNLPINNRDLYISHV